MTGESARSETIAGYRIIARLGRGAYGVVFRAVHPSGGEVALKVLSDPGPIDAIDPRETQRFRREAAVLRSLDHPNIVRIRDVGSDEHGRRYIAMDLVDGEPVDDRLRREGVLPPEEAAWIARKLAIALDHAHGRGVVHRDIKPANIILDRLGEPRLADFGLARSVRLAQTRLTVSGASFGTPGFWPPEQATGALDQVGPASDIYSLGATLYAMLTGTTPFREADVAAQVMATVRKPPPPPSTRRPGIAPELDAICLRCLAKVPDQRFGSGVELAAELDRYLGVSHGSGSGRHALRRGPPGAGPASRPASSSSGGSRPSTGSRRFEPPGRTGPPVAILAALGGVLLVGGIGIGVALSGRPNTAMPTSTPAPTSASAGDGPAPGGATTTTKRPERESLDARIAAILDRAAGYTERRESDLAAGELDRAIDLLADEGAWGDPPIAPRHRSLVIDHLEGRSLAASTDPAEERVVIDRLLAIDPQLLWARGKLLALRMGAGDFEGALDEIDLILESNPGDRSALRDRTRCYVRLGRLAEAMGELERLLARDPGDVVLRGLRGEVLAGLGRLDEAEQDLALAVAALASDDPDRDALEASLRRAVASRQSSPSPPSAETSRMLDLAQAAFREGRREDAIRTLTTILTETPGLHDARSLRMLAYSALDRTAEAVADAEILLAGSAIAPRLVGSSLWTRGRWRARREDSPGALADYDRMLALEPGFTLGFFERAVIHSKLGAFAAARRDLDVVLTRGLPSQELTARRLRAMANESLGDQRAALVDLEALLQRTPPGSARTSLEEKIAELRETIGG